MITKLLIVSILSLSTALGQVFQVTPNKENVVASKLVGTWILDTKVTLTLTGKDKASVENALTKVKFIEDNKITTKIPKKYEKFIKDKTIYMAGSFLLNDVSYPFILIELNGNPHVVFFRERDGDPYGDAESFNVMLAVAKDTKNDLLFIGGDFNNQPFSGYKRQKMDNKAQ